MNSHFERKFRIEENQKIWDAYFDGSLEAWIKNNKPALENQEWTEEEKIKERKRLLSYNMSLDNITPYKVGYIKKKQSLQQYKPIVIQFEEYVNKSFNEITAKDIDTFALIIEKKNKLTHLNAFLLYCVSNRIIRNKDKCFLISLLPEAYRKIGKIIAE